MFPKTAVHDGTQQNLALVPICLVKFRRVPYKGKITCICTIFFYDFFTTKRWSHDFSLRDKNQKVIMQMRKLLLVVT